MSPSTHPRLKILAAIAPILALLSTNLAPHPQRTLTQIPDTDPAAQLASFQLDPTAGLEITLWASEPMAAKPIQMNWDSQGRMWLASSTLYPQVAPGQVEKDQVIVLEDTDHDGKADRHTVFADGLHLPTGVMPTGHGSAAYVSNATDLLLLRDTDGDLVADQKEVVLTGFGTEDTHHILHTFRRGPSGLLHFNQSIYIHSHIETPHGVRRLYGGGFWAFRPADRRLEVVAKGLINSWGYEYDSWGQAFATDGAGSEGINHIFPGAVFRTAPGEPHILPGLNPGQPKHCGLAIIESDAFPDAWQGSLLACDFRGHRINRFTLRPDGSSYLSTQENDLLASTHGSFRPIDVRHGPDGALYIADWYNPIIQHGEVDFRDPRRDHTHGRIWRIAPKGHKPKPIPPFATLEIPDLLQLLARDQGWNRRQAKQELLLRDPDTVTAALPTFLAQATPQGQLQALWLTRGLGQFDLALFQKLAQDTDPRARSGAIRAATRIAEPIPGTQDALAAAANDPHPQVRLMAIAALHQIDTPQAFAAALAALDHELDTALEFRLARFARLAAETWLPAYTSGDITLPHRATFALARSQNPLATGGLLTLLQQDLTQEEKTALLPPIIQHASPDQLAGLLKTTLAWPAPAREAALTALAKARHAPSGGADALLPLLAQSPAAAALAGRWKLQGAAPALRQILQKTGTPHAATALASIEGKAAVPFFTQIAQNQALTLDARANAARALVPIAPQHAAKITASLLADIPDPNAQSSTLFTTFLQRKGGGDLLAAALGETQLPKPVAIQGIQAIGRSGKAEPKLSDALHQAGQVRRMDKPLTPDELAALVAKVEQEGDPAKGETIYRRQALLCQVCHAIGEAGGAIGPDLVSIGASAPVDYLIESLLEPNKKIKEGYHTTMISTQGGQMLAGGTVSESDTELVLRDAAGQLHQIPKDTIANIQVSPVSLMPPGLTATLREDEFADLVAFLSKLGKEGSYKTGPQQHIRTWRALPRLTAAQLDPIGHQGLHAFADPKANLPWAPAYTKVSGHLPLDEVEPQRGRRIDSKAIQFRLTASRAGDATLALTPHQDVRLWIGQDEVKDIGPTITLPIPDGGEHAITLLIKARDNRYPPTIRATLADPGTASARPLGGP